MDGDKLVQQGDLFYRRGDWDGSPMILEEYKLFTPQMRKSAFACTTTHPSWSETLTSFMLLTWISSAEFYKAEPLPYLAVVSEERAGVAPMLVTVDQAIKTLALKYSLCTRQLLHYLQSTCVDMMWKIRLC
jgi:hypothetical protein